MTDWDAHLEEQVAWLAAMWRRPETRAHAWARAQEMAAQHPELYGTVPDPVRAAVRDTTAPAAPTATPAGSSSPCER